MHYNESCRPLRRGIGRLSFSLRIDAAISREPKLSCTITNLAAPRREGKRGEGGGAGFPSKLVRKRNARIPRIARPER